MNDTRLKTIEQIRAFLSGSEALRFSIRTTEDRYAWLEPVWVRLREMTLNKTGKGGVRRYLIKTTGDSRQQLSRLIQQYKKKVKGERRQSARPRFHRPYTEQDIVLLAQTGTGTAP